jgi:ribonuclease-3 family protein
MAADLNAYLNEKFGIKEQDIRTYSPLTLAYIGDAVFDVIIRSILVNKGNTAVNKLHTRASGIVKAQTQAGFVAALMDEFTQEEADYYRRGRNSKPHTKAKNASTMDYLEATGFEAVIGFLYMTDNLDRACELIQMGIDRLGLDILTHT